LFSGAIKQNFGFKMTTVQVLKQLGEQISLKGTDLKDFIKEQEEIEREQRTKQIEEPEKQQEHIER